MSVGMMSFRKSFLCWSSSSPSSINFQFLSSNFSVDAVCLLNYLIYLDRILHITLPILIILLVTAPPR